jgi:hypothetical protein
MSPADIFSVDQPGDGTTIREDAIAGRKAYVMEFSEDTALDDPTDDGSVQTSQYASETPAVPGFALPPFDVSFRSSMWIDSEYFLLLRNEFSMAVKALGDNSLGLPPIEATMETLFTDIEINGEIPDDLFRFTPPQGAAEVDHIDLGFESGLIYLPDEEDEEEWLPPGEEALPLVPIP